MWQISRAGTILILLICALAGAALLSARHKGYEISSVQTDSMHPFIAAGSAVIIDTGNTQLSINDVITYASPKNDKVLVTHRVISVDHRSGTFTARGDNLEFADPQVPLSSVKGTVAYSVPLAGYAFDAFRSPAGLILAVYIPALGIAFGELRRLSHYYAGRSHHRYVLYGSYR